MSERWRRPVTFAVSGHSSRVTVEGDRLFHEPELAISDEAWNRICAGYVCPRCFEPHERPFPKACGVCGLAKTEAVAQINEMLAGQLPETESYADEAARLGFESEQRRHRPGSSIILPRGVNLDG